MMAGIVRLYWMKVAFIRNFIAHDRAASVGVGGVGREGEEGGGALGRRALTGGD
jgi:hypothetical protein